MNDLERYFYNNPSRMIDKWLHYFEVYERHLSRFRGTRVNVVEIGVYQGGSLQMWKNYFGPEATIYGVDLNPLCKQFEEDQIRILIGDQADRDFLTSLADQVGEIDILIDDGGHVMRQLRTTFEVLLPRISPHGVYLAEDLHTCYWPEYGGGHLSPWSFIEFSKNLIDRLNAWHSRDPQGLPVSDITRTIHSIHYYDSIMVVEKRPILPPKSIKTGVRVLPDEVFPPPIP